MDKPARFVASDRVRLDTKLSIGARLLYWDLDARSGSNAECWPRQATLAKELGVSIRHIRRWLAELEPYIQTIKHQYTAIYKLRYSERTSTSGLKAPERTSTSGLKAPERTSVVVQSGHGCPVSSLFTEQKNLTKQASDASEALGVLRKYPYAEHLLGSPDDKLVQECLVLAGGLDGFCEAMKAMFREKRRPDRSWGWFPVALQSYVRRQA